MLSTFREEVKKMAQTESGQAHSLTARPDQPLIGVPLEEDGQPVVRYFTDEDEADRALGDDSVQQALALIGAWKDIDSPDALDILDRIRHESKPTPPIDEL
jgi:hypothetical protein